MEVDVRGLAQEPTPLTSRDSVRTEQEGRPLASYSGECHQVIVYITVRHRAGSAILPVLASRSRVAPPLVADTTSMLMSATRPYRPRVAVAKGSEPWLIGDDKVGRRAVVRVGRSLGRTLNGRNEEARGWTQRERLTRDPKSISHGPRESKNREALDLSGLGHGLEALGLQGWPRSLTTLSCG